LAFSCFPLAAGLCTLVGNSPVERKRNQHLQADPLFGTDGMPIDDKDLADRLLRKMHPVFSHDLPNQMVALQSLLQFLGPEEASRLSGEGREHLDRLRRVAHKAGGMVRFLKELGRLGSYQPHVEEVSLGILMGQLKADLQEQMPGANLECRLDADATVAADARLLCRALVEIVRCLLEGAGACPRSLHLQAQPVDLGPGLVGQVLFSGPRAARVDTTNLDQRLEIILAQEMLSLWGARLLQIRETADRSILTVLLP
jgi:hypothetical protein